MDALGGGRGGRLEERGPGHRRLQRQQRRPDDPQAQVTVGLRGQLRVTAGVLHLHTADDPVGVGGNGDRRQRADQRRGNADSLELLRDRCAATMAAPSPGNL